MENEKYLNDITEIKNLMNKSSRFISLSGLSGILAGVYALVGAWFAYKTIYFDTSTLGAYRDLIISEAAVIRLLVIATSVLVLSIITGILLSGLIFEKLSEKPLFSNDISTYKDWLSSTYKIGFVEIEDKQKQIAVKKEQHQETVKRYQFINSVLKGNFEKSQGLWYFQTVLPSLYKDIQELYTGNVILGDLILNNNVVEFQVQALQLIGCAQVQFHLFVDAASANQGGV